MSREIYTYIDLAKLKDCPVFQEIKKYPQIAVSTDLRKGLKGTLDVDRVDGIFSKDPSVSVVEFQAFAKELNGDFNTDHCKFNETILLSEFLRAKIEEAEDDKEKQNWLIGCRRNISPMLSALILLEQADVKPEDLDITDDRNIALFVEAWKYVIERDPVLIDFRERMKSLNDKSTWNPILNSLYKCDNQDFNTLVFHGFYYFTPFQQRVMEMLEKAGFRLIFLFLYDERYPFVYEIWDNTYSEKNGYPSKNQWYMERENTNDPYGDIFEGKEHVEIENNLSIREYGTVMEFVNDVKKVRKEGYSVYSSNFKTINKLLKDYYPDEYGDRKILSYPIGHFVSTLNQMWDDELQTIVLEKDRLIECFSSGWLAVDGVSGRQFLQDLTYVLPFFENCHTIAEWESRIALLKEIQEDVIAPFLIELDPEESISRWQEAIGNPMANFSMFSVEAKKLDIILALIKQLLDMARELFGTNQMIAVQEHIYKLDQILKRYEISNDLYEEERNLVSGIFEALDKPSDFKSKCAPSDIARALSMFISGKYEEGEIETNRVGLVYPLFFIDAACIKNKSKVHICMCDADSMPGGNKDYIWPLSGRLMKKCYDKTNNSLILNIMQIMESGPLCNRYFMYCALKNKDVEVSWISVVDDNVLQPSPYIRLVCDAADVKLIPAVRHQITFQRVADRGYGTGRIDEYDNSKTPKGMVKEARMAYALCPMKYTLGYVVDKYPTYQSEFQQMYALNALISAIYGLMKDEGMTLDEVYKNVMSLFPSLRKVEKRQVYDYMRYERNENDLDYGSRTECGGDYYTDQRIKVHYPNQDVREFTIGRFGKLMTPDGRKGLNLYETITNNADEKMKGQKDVSKSVCTFCPHIDYCRNAVFSVDQEKYYD